MKSRNLIIVILLSVLVFVCVMQDRGIAVGDKVTVAISSYELEKGRITFRHRN